jgi:hypothetical protein
MRFLHPPTFRHLTHETGRLARWGSIGAGLFGLALLAYTLIPRITRPGGYFIAYSPPVFIGLWALVIAGLLGSGAAAAQIARRIADDDATRLLSITPIPPGALLRTLMLATLFQMRAWLALLLAVLPALALQTRYRALSMLFRSSLPPAYFILAPLSGSLYFTLIMPLTRAGTVLPFFGWVAGLWGCLLLAALIGARLALRGRNAAFAALAAGLAAALLAPLLLIPTFALPVNALSLPVRIGLTIALALIPYCAAACLLLGPREKR